jgi:hypothetical protein
MTPILRREGVTNQESARDSRQILKTGYPAHGWFMVCWTCFHPESPKITPKRPEPRKKLASKHVDGKTPSGYDIHSLPWRDPPIYKRTVNDPFRLGPSKNHGYVSHNQRVYPIKTTILLVKPH